MSNPTPEASEYIVKRHHADIGEISFKVKSTDTAGDVHRIVAQGLRVAALVYQATPGMTAQPLKSSDKAKESRLDPDIVLNRIWFKPAWIPSAGDAKKPDVDAIKRIVGIVFAGVPETPTYDRDTYRNWVSLTVENAERVLRNIALAPADIPATDIGNLVTWYFGGTPAEPPVTKKKTEAPLPPPSDTPDVAPAATNMPPAATPEPTPAETSALEYAENIDTKALYLAAWEKFGILATQCNTLIGKLNQADRTRRVIWDCVTAYASAAPVNADELIRWTLEAFEFTDLPGVLPQDHKERLRTIAQDAYTTSPLGSRMSLYLMVQARIEALTESVTTIAS